MKKRALLIALGPVYGLTKSGYPSFSTIRNIKRVNDQLVSHQWNSIDSILEKNGTKKNIISAIESIQKVLDDGDALLVYYFGHCDKIKTKVGSQEVNPDDIFDEFLVTYHEELEQYTQPYDSAIFLTDDDYTNIMLPYFQRNTSRFLISVFDCCFSQGMIDKPLLDLNNHLVIASSSAAVESWTHPIEGSYLSQGLSHTSSKSRTTHMEYCKTLEDFMIANNFSKPFTKIGQSFNTISLIL